MTMAKKISAVFMSVLMMLSVFAVFASATDSKATAPTATIVGNDVFIKWDQPFDDADAITSYTITYGLKDDILSTNMINVESDKVDYVIKDLAPGDYSITVSAFNKNHITDVSVQSLDITVKSYSSTILSITDFVTNLALQIPGLQSTILSIYTAIAGLFGI